MKTVLLLLITTLVFAHPHHHSLAIVDYNVQSKQLELSLKLLTEDYNKIAEIEKYINKNLIIAQDEQPLTGVFQGMEQNVESTWLYFTIDLIKANTKKLTVRNTLFLSINENQFNTVKLSFGEMKSSYNFSKQETKHIFTLDNTALKTSGM